MAVFKCKMCGGELNIHDGDSVAECEFCGSKQTLPKLDDDKRANLYDRANHFRRANEYDKAMSIYERILEEDTEDAEAYWSIVLCRYGIDYVEDPTSHKRIPTVNRMQSTSILADEDYKQALAYADSAQKAIYEEEAKVIENIQKGILEISSKEKPYDVFICYKETDSSGNRTQDSVLAQDLYYQLTQEGFKVFFSRITLESKLGSAYEPYIFAALNSSKVMVVIGTQPEYFKAVWVKNEWSRFLALMKKNPKKMLVPAYKGMDPYDIPDELSHLQAQDMSKLGFMQDLVRGIKKILADDKPKKTEAVVATTSMNNANNANIEALYKRAKLFLEDGDFDSANEYAERILDINPEYAEAYLVKLLVDYKLKKQADLNTLKNEEFIANNKNYQKIIRFADETLKTEMMAYEKKQREMVEGAIIHKDGIKYERIDELGVYACYIENHTIKVANIKSSFYGLPVVSIDFSNCTALTSVTIPSSVTSIGESAFSGCSSLTSVTIPSSVTSIGKGAFKDCYSLKRVDITDIASWCNISFTDLMSNPLTYARNLYLNGELVKDLVIPKGVTSIGDNAFSCCSSLTSLIIPDSVKSIGESAFSSCHSLTSVIIPDSVTSIGKFAFSCCSSLTSVTIPDSVKSIEKCVFSSCSSLTSVTIPDSVTSIGSYALGNCSSLTSITIPDSVNSIEYHAFKGAKLKYIRLPKQYHSISAKKELGIKLFTKVE